MAVTPMGGESLLINEVNMRISNIMQHIGFGYYK